MIGFLRGALHEIRSSTIILDVGGVGYEIEPTRTAALNLTEIGSNISLTIFTDVRETAITLYGFKDVLEREVFLLTRTVKGIGSKLALSIVSELGAERLLAAIGGDDVTTLRAVPGIGKKTAERLVVELREKVSDYLPSSDPRALGQQISVQRLASSTSPEIPNALDPTALDAILALQKLGFDQASAHDAVNRVFSEVVGADQLTDAGQLVRFALAQLR